MANLDEAAARFEQRNSSPQPFTAAVGESMPAAPEQGFTTYQVQPQETTISQTQHPLAISREVKDEERERIASLEQQIATMRSEMSSMGSSDELKSIVLAGLGTTIGRNASRERAGKGKIVAAGALCLIAGAGGMYLLMRNEINEYASAAEQACEFTAPVAGEPFLEDNASNNAPASPTTIPSVPNRNALSSVNAISPEVAGELQLSGASFAIQEYSDGSLIESDTVFEWETQLVNANHDNYVIQLQQQTLTGHISDSRMQRYIAEGDYTKEELLQFLVKNNVVDPNVQNAYIKLVGSDTEELTVIVTGA